MSVDRVVKRNGTVVSFDRVRIENGIYAAARAAGNGESRQWAEALSWAVVGMLEERFGQNGNRPHVKEIQDIVEEVLVKSGSPQVAKTYILYRQKRAEVRATRQMFLNVEHLVDDYLQRADWRVNENSNMNYSLQGLNFYVASSIAARYWLHKIYPSEAQRAHVEGDLHLHDLGMLSTYTYFGKEVIIAKSERGIELISFAKLYELCKQPEATLNAEEEVYAKFPSGLQVLDRDGWTGVSRLVRKKRHRPMRFVKNRGGRSVIVTDNHPMLTRDGEKEAVKVKESNDYLLTVDLRRLLKDEGLFSKQYIDLAHELSQRELPNIQGRGQLRLNSLVIDSIVPEIEIDNGDMVSIGSHAMPRYVRLTEKLGKCIGWILADGFASHGAKTNSSVTVVQKEITHLVEIADMLRGVGVPSCIDCWGDRYELVIPNRVFRLLLTEVFQIGYGAQNKILPVQILQFNEQFVKGLLAGLIDGDGNAHETQIQLRLASRTMLEQFATVLYLLGVWPRDRAIDGLGTERMGPKGQVIKQRYPIYGVAFRKTGTLALDSFKYKEARASNRKWMDETDGEWHKVLNNKPTNIPDEFIYDITTDTRTLVVNGMWNHNCCGWDLQDLLIQGFGGVSAKIESKPPKHLRTALGQLVNFFYTLQGESAGAVAVSNFDTLLAPFIRYDGLDFGKTKQALQEYVFNINVPTRVGFQTPFTNQTMDLTPPSTLRDQPVIIGGEPRSETYGEFQREMDMINRAFAEVMLEGDAKGRVFSVDYASYSLVREDGAIQLIRIGEYIDRRMASASPLWLEDKQAEMSDVRHLDIETIGVKAGRVGWYKVNYLVRHPTDRLLKITTAGGFNVKVTPSHSVLVVKGGNIVAYKASDLKPGDYLITPRKLDSGGDSNTTISLAHEFNRRNPQGIYLHGAKNREGHPYKEIRTTKGQKTYRYKVSVIPLAHTVDVLGKLDLSEARLGLAGSDIQIPNNITVDEQLLEFLGYFVAEGSVAKGPYGGVSLGFNLAKERELANRIAEWMRKTFGTHATVREVPDRTLVEVRDHSKLLRRILIEVLGIKNGVERKVPDLVFNASDELKRAFLGGYFDGDAYRTEKALFVSTVAPDVAYGVSTLLKQLGVAHTLTEYTKNGGSQIYRVNLWDPELVGREHRTIGKLPIEASGLEAVLEAMLEQEPRYEDTLSRSYRNSLNRVMTKYGIHRQESVSVEKARQITEDAKRMGIKVPQGLESLVDSDLIFLKVRTVEESLPTTGMVYDFSTDADSFLANQILVHNTFPIPTYNVTRDFDWDNPELEPVWAMTARYGIPYWANFVNSDMSPEDARSMCCRLRLDNRELRKRIGGLFAAAPLTGSVGVVTINMPRLGYLAHDEPSFQERLEQLMEVARTSLEIKRQVLERLTAQGLYPYSHHYLQGIKKRFGNYWSNHFSTIGLIGMNEASLNLLGVGIAHPEGKSFAVRTLKFMREVLARFQEETGQLYNLEATPAEGASFRLARADRERFSDIVTAGAGEAPYYTNSSHLPVSHSDDLFEVLEHQDELQVLYTGGTVQHVFLGEQLDDWRQARRLVRTIAENFHLPYYTLTPTFSICPVHGYISGKHPYCPHEHTEEELMRFGRLVKE